MVRTQIQLTEEQARDLKKLAARKGISMAELIRRSVADTLKRESAEYEERWKRALSVVGMFDSGLTDVSENHDKYLEEAYMDWKAITPGGNSD